MGLGERRLHGHMHEIGWEEDIGWKDVVRRRIRGMI